ncbi:hypothetical protein GCM10010909_03930 [Acidocella aquatica]|uniref:Uncharacterized protein n=1 Tax=Acidocella aquatica TaxID=1922313 RepID=A0ABQ6A379_9PROT|nr:hypothetical protein GCM10010909_03930 [Acidocella aquatica]
MQHRTPGLWKHGRHAAKLDNRDTGLNNPQVAQQNLAELARGPGLPIGGQAGPHIAREMIRDSFGRA